MPQNLVSLAKINKGQRCIVRQIDENLLPHNVELEAGELERRILEIGIIEGVELTVLHFGLINRDPIAVQLGFNGTTIAIRRNESAIILVEAINQD
jgi:ferrous iron transport protein A